MNIKYVSGKKPQYKLSKWHSYEYLRSEGFMKWEARELLKITEPKSNVVLKEMLTARHRLINKLVGTADANGWTDGKTRYEFSRAVRQFYRSHKLLNVAGLPDVWSYYHVAENRTATRRGWKKGAYDRKDKAGKDTEGVVQRRPNKNQGSGRGRWSTIKAAKAKARSQARANFYKKGSRLSDPSTVLTRSWIKDLNAKIKVSSGADRDRFVAQRERLQKLVK